MQSPPDALQTASCKFLTNTQRTLMHMHIIGDDVHEQSRRQKWAACIPDNEGCTSLQDNNLREEHKAVRVTAKTWVKYTIYACNVHTGLYCIVHLSCCLSFSVDLRYCSHVCAFPFCNNEIPFQTTKTALMAHMPHMTYIAG